MDNETKKRTDDAIAKMKTKRVNHRICDVADEIETRGRTDHRDDTGEKKYLNKNRNIKKENKSAKRSGKFVNEEIDFDIDDIFQGRDSIPASEAIRKLKDLGYSFNENQDIYDEEEKELDGEEILTEDDGDMTFVEDEDDMLTEEDEAPAEESEEENPDDEETEEDSFEFDEEPADSENPDENMEETETDEETVEEETPRDETGESEEQVWTNEDDLSNVEASNANIDDVDSIIDNILDTSNKMENECRKITKENFNINIDADGRVTIEDRPSESETTINDLKLSEIAKELGIADVDDSNTLDADEDMDEVVDQAEENEKMIGEQVQNMVKMFGKKYPKVFNESTIKKLGKIVEMYAEAKAKTKAFKKISKSIKSVDAYMMNMTNKFIKENKDKIVAAYDSKRKTAALEKVATLIEKKIASDKKVNALVETNTEMKRAINRMLKEKKERDAKDTLEKKKSLFFEAVKNFDKDNKRRVEKLIENYKTKDINTFTSKLNEAVQYVFKKYVMEKKENPTIDEKKKIVTSQKAVRRSDGILSLESIQEAVKNRKELPLDENDVIAESNDSEAMDISKYEKYIY